MGVRLRVVFCGGFTGLNSRVIFGVLIVVRMLLFRVSFGILELPRARAGILGSGALHYGIWAVGVQTVFSRMRLRMYIHIYIHTYIYIYIYMEIHTYNAL